MVRSLRCFDDEQGQSHQIQAIDSGAIVQSAWRGSTSVEGLRANPHADGAIRPARGGHPRQAPSWPAGSGAAKAAKEALPPKYLDPKTGATWSGRGRAPAWLGEYPNRFLIAEE